MLKISGNNVYIHLFFLGLGDNVHTYSSKNSQKQSPEQMLVSSTCIVKLSKLVMKIKNISQMLCVKKKTFRHEKTKPPATTLIRLWFCGYMYM